MFLSFSVDEMEVVEDVLKAAGYPPDAGGLKEWVMDCMMVDEKDEPDPVSNLTDFLKANPEKILGAALSAISRVTRGR